jgi:hypothetical protein
MRLSTATLCAFLVFGTANAPAADMQPDSFAFKPPADLTTLKKTPAWFTDYIDDLVDEDSTAGSVPLVDTDGHSFNVSLSHRSWCNASNDGTITVQLTNHQTRNFNFAGRTKAPQTDCTDVLTGFKPSDIPPINRSAFSELPSDAPFGLGVKSSYRLVPARSVAIDLSHQGKFHLGDVLYIPALTKVEITLPDGSKVHHDGYVMAVDKVSACSGTTVKPRDCNTNHIDYFKGRTRSDALPRPLESDPRHPLDVYRVTDPAIIDVLTKAHTRD